MFHSSSKWNYHSHSWLSPFWPWALFASVSHQRFIRQSRLIRQAIYFGFSFSSSDSATACQGHDSPCVGANGSQGNCCGGMHCQKNDPTWARGRCYYNPGKWYVKNNNWSASNLWKYLIWIDKIRFVSPKLPIQLFPMTLIIRCTKLL